MKKVLNLFLPTSSYTSSTCERKISKIYIFLMAAISILVFYIGFTLAFDRQNLSISASIIIGIISAVLVLAEFFLLPLIASIIDSIFFKTKFTLLNYIRVLIPLRIIHHYLRAGIEFLPIYAEDISVLIINLWLLLNIFVALKKATNYNTIKSIVVTAASLIYITLTSFS